MRIVVYCILAIAIGGAVGAYLGSGDQHSPGPIEASPIEPGQPDTVASSPVQAQCDHGTPASGRLYPGGKEIEFRSGPGAEFEHVVNRRAGQQRTLWPTMVLNALCETEGWVQGKIVEADGSPRDWETGWVEKRYVSGAMSDDQKRGLLWDVAGESDFTQVEKSMIRDGALKVLARESNCREIITGYRSGSREGAYYVTCNARNGGAPFNVWFTPDEVRSGAALGVPRPYSEDASRQACVDAIKDRATNPSTVDVHSLLGYASDVHNNGNRTVVQEFSASNSFGLEIEYRATCLIQPDGSTEIAIHEVR